MKTCILAMQRYEKDIFEWIDYHLYKVGFDHIFIIDTNDEGDELTVYNDRVTIMHKQFYDVPEGHHWSEMQIQMYNDEIDNLVDAGYDWCGVIDIDEYFDFNGKTVQEYLVKFHFHHYTTVEIMWRCYTGNNLTFNHKANVDKAYTKSIESEPGWMQNRYNWAKPLFKLDYGIRFKESVHWVDDHIYSNGQHTKRYHVTGVDGTCIRHYRTKSLNDFLDKIAYRRFSESELVRDLDGVINSFFYYNDKDKAIIDNFVTLAEMKGINLNDKELEKIKKLLT